MTTIGDPNPWAFTQRAAQQSFIAAHHVAISPFMYNPLERWKWHLGTMRIREGEARMKAEKEKHDQRQD